MHLYIKFLNGEREGDIIRIQKGMTFGRSAADVDMQDLKVSSLHAQIGHNKNGDLALFDLKSSNGTRFQGKRIKYITLKPGQILLLGESELEVVTALTAQVDSRQKIKPWREHLYAFLDFVSIDAKVKNTKAFPQTLELEFLEGFQRGEKWIVGYGPRDFGRACPEFPILEPSSPDIAFSLSLLGDCVLFKTKHAEQVLLNEQPTHSDKLVDGSTIQIEKTKIKVSFK